MRPQMLQSFQAYATADTLVMGALSGALPSAMPQDTNPLAAYEQ